MSGATSSQLINEPLLVVAGEHATASPGSAPAAVGDRGIQESDSDSIPQPSVVGTTFEALQREVVFRTDPEPRERACCCCTRSVRRRLEAERQRRLSALGVPESVRQLCVFSGNYVQTNKVCRPRACLRAAVPPAGQVVIVPQPRLLFCAAATAF